MIARRAAKVSRREFMGACAAGMGAAMMSEATGGEAAKASAFAEASASAKATADKPADKPARPNILFALADDWGFGHAGAYGCRWVKTPGLTAEPERLERNSPGQRPGGM